MEKHLNNLSEVKDRIFRDVLDYGPKKHHEQKEYKDDMSILTYNDVKTWCFFFG